MFGKGREETARLLGSTIGIRGFISCSALINGRYLWDSNKQIEKKKSVRFDYHILEPGILLLCMVTRLFVTRFHKKKGKNSKCLLAGFRVTRVYPDPASAENRVGGGFWDNLPPTVSKIPLVIALFWTLKIFIMDGWMDGIIFFFFFFFILLRYIANV